MACNNTGIEIEKCVTTVNFNKTRYIYPNQNFKLTNYTTTGVETQIFVLYF